MKLNLGCSNRHMPGYVNVDIVPPADEIADLNGRWPWGDNSIEEILAQDIIEHLPDKIHTMNEAWRVLCPDGLFFIDVPTTDGRGAWQDPTHCSSWNRNSFWYYEENNIYRTRFCQGNGTLARFKVIEESETRDMNDVTKLNIVLQAVKG